MGETVSNEGARPYTKEDLDRLKQLADSLSEVLRPRALVSASFLPDPQADPEQVQKQFGDASILQTPVSALKLYIRTRSESMVSMVREDVTQELQAAGAGNVQFEVTVEDGNQVWLPRDHENFNPPEGQSYYEVEIGNTANPATLQHWNFESEESARDFIQEQHNCGCTLVFRLSQVVNKRGAVFGEGETVEIGPPQKS